MLDAFSQKILRLLQRDARRSVQEISEQVGLSSTPCWRRIKDMEQQGIIQRYTALLDREKLGLHFSCLLHVTLNRQAEAAAATFERAVDGWSEVTECYRTAGPADYVLKLITVDVKAYDVFLQERLLQLPSVASTSTSLVLKELKFSTELPQSGESALKIGPVDDFVANGLTHPFNGLPNSSSRVNASSVPCAEGVLTNPTLS